MYTHVCTERNLCLIFTTILIDSFICIDEETEPQSQDPTPTLICGIPGATSRRYWRLLSLGSSFPCCWLCPQTPNVAWLWHSYCTRAAATFLMWWLLLCVSPHHLRELGWVQGGRHGHPILPSPSLSCFYHVVKKSHPETAVSISQASPASPNVHCLGGWVLYKVDWVG